MLHIMVESAPPPPQQALIVRDVRPIVQRGSLCTAMSSPYGRHCGSQLMITFNSATSAFSHLNGTLAFHPYMQPASGAKAFTGGEHGQMQQEEVILNKGDVS